MPPCGSLERVSGFVVCALTQRKRTGYPRIRRRYGCRLTRPWITAKAWLMSCGDNPEANMAS
eukprot:1441553-Pleurochrysis_carterae.AAC.1